MSNLSLPPRFREPSVLRFAEVIKAAAKNYPQAIIVNPLPLAKETYRCRFRDALKAIMEYDVCPELLAYAKIVWGDVRIEEFQDDSLIIGPNHVLRRRDKVNRIGTVLDGVVNVSTLAEEVTPTEKIILAAVVLLEAGFLSDVTFNATEDKIKQYLPSDCPLTIMEKNGRTTLF
tara:strand:+ start:7657 stop:8178 length:522 start_codon:yes stop_codon:yes gene_type:complete